MTTNKYFGGWDNGITGTLTLLTSEGQVEFFIKVPCFKEQNYTKKSYITSRIDTKKLFQIFHPYKEASVHFILERPLVCPQYFSSTCSAMRSLEATLIVLNNLGFSYEFIDSKEWQDQILPEYWEGKFVEKETLKEASLGVGKQLYPQVDFKGMKDADGLLIGHYCRQKYLNTGENNV
jgi:hypothetical protein